MSFRGFHVENNLWQNSAIRSLSQTQRGILSDIFSLLSSETKKVWWGFLIDRNKKPLTERALRVYLGQSNAALGLTTWRTARGAFLESGILKLIRIGECEYLYCAIFSEMNSYDSTRRRTAMMSQAEQTKTSIDRRPRGGTEAFLGYDPNDSREDSALDSWGRLCRLWIELTGGKSPMRIDMAHTTRIAIRDDFVQRAEEMGLENALQDIRNKFSEKESAGGEINSIAYLISRWNAPDWKKRFDKSPERQVEKKDKEAQERLEQEVRILFDDGTITNRAELFTYFPAENEENLKVVAGIFGL